VFDEAGNQIRLSGWTTDAGWQGNGYTPAGDLISWQLSRSGDLTSEGDDSANSVAA
jgi:hypothetical protein